MPLAFEPSGGGEYLARSGNFALRVNAAGAMFGSRGMRLDGANPSARAIPEHILPGKYNYIAGADPRQWRTNVPTYARVRFHDVYPGIDLVYYGKGRELEFDFVVAPCVDLGRIRVLLSGTDVKMSEPRLYQGQAQGGRAISGRAVRQGKHIAFQVGAYDRSRRLVIDPVLSFATLFGGGRADLGSAVAVDRAGSIYVTGSTSSANFPVVNALQFSAGFATFSPLQISPPEGQHAFVAKLNADGTALDYATFLGGSGVESGVGIAVDSAGSAYIAGTTTSNNFPGAIDPPSGGSSTGVYAVKLSPDGSKLLYSTYVGERKEGGGAIAVDRLGSAYITHGDYMSKLNGAGTKIYTAWLAVTPSRIAADDFGNVYVAGGTSSRNLPIRNAFQSALQGPSNAFVVKLDSSGAVAYATYLGGVGSDSARAIAVDAAGSAYVAGTTSSTNFPTARPLQHALAAALAYKTVDGAASWSRSDFGLGASPSFLAADPSNSANLYALAGGRLYKTTDGGANWFVVLGGIISALAISPSAPSTIYASRFAIAALSQPQGILRSVDGGLTWSNVSTHAPFKVLAVDPRNPETVYGGLGGSQGNDGVYKSTDGGATWNASGLVGEGNGIQALAIAPSALYALFATSNAKGTSTSTDSGDHWTAAKYFPIFHPTDSSIVYALDRNTNSIMKSTDGGITFSRQGGPPMPNVFVYVLAIDPNATATLYAGTSRGVYKSTDSGANWQAMNNGLSDVAIPAMIVDPIIPSTVYVASPGDADGFVTKLSPDGSQLVYSTYLGGHGTDLISAVALGDDGSAYLAGSTASTDFPTRDPFRTAVRPAGSDGFVAKLSADGSLLWSSFLGGGLPAGIAVSPAGSLYVTGSTPVVATFPTAGSIQYGINSDIYRSRDGGASWTGNLPGGPSILFFAVDPKTPSRVFSATGGALYLSTDSGANWSTALAGDVKFLIFDPINPSILYALGSFAFYSSTNGGVNWTRSNRPSAFATGLVIDPKNPATLYLATYNGVYKSTNSGSTWALAGSDTGAAVALVIDPQNPSTLYVGGQPVVRKSTDGGATWILANAVCLRRVRSRFWPSTPSRHRSCTLPGRVGCTAPPTVGQAGELSTKAFGNNSVQV